MLVDIACCHSIKCIVETVCATCMWHCSAMVTVHVHYSHLVPSVLDCGYCLAGSRKTVTIECCNNGGEGNFQLTCGGGSDEPQQMQVCMHVMVLD